MANSPGIGIPELVNRLSIHQSICRQLVEKLVARDLLIKERSLEDQRHVGLVVTETTKELLAHAPGPLEGVLAKALNTLRGDDLFALDIVLAEVISHLSNKDDSFADKPMSDL